jgi:hypothetical protein
MGNNWKTLIKTDELQTLEKPGSDMTIRLEARQNSDKTWSIIKRYYNSKNINYTEEFRTSSSDDLDFFLTKLQKKNLGVDELKDLQLLQLGDITLHPKRIFKEYNIEKWNFCVNEGSYNNTIMIRYADRVDIDLYIFERYKCIEEKLLLEIKEVFGIDEAEIDININTFYFSSHNSKKLSVQNQLNFVLNAPFDPHDNDCEGI